MDITARGGDDTFRLSPTSGRLSDINGLLTVFGGNGDDRLSVNDVANIRADGTTVAPASYFLSLNELSPSDFGLARNGKVHVRPLGIEALDLSGNDRGNSFGIEPAGSSRTLQITGGAGDDIFRLAPRSKNLDAIGSEITLVGRAGKDTVEADDRLNAAGATFKYDTNFQGHHRFLSRNAKEIADIRPGIEDVKVFAGVGADTFHVELTHEDVELTLNGGIGDDTFQLAPTAKNLNVLAGTVTVNGGGGDDRMLVNDQANSAGSLYLATPAKLNRTVGTKSVDIKNSGLERLAIQGGAGDDSLKFIGVPGHHTINYDPGAGNDTLGGMAAENVFSVSAKDTGTLSLQGIADVVHFSSTENLAGNAFDDTFKFANGTRVTGRVDGLGGSDTLDYSAYTTRVNIHLILGLATGIDSGGTVTISQIENAIGGSAGDSFVGDEEDNIFIGTFGHAGPPPSRNDPRRAQRRVRAECHRPEPDGLRRCDRRHHHGRHGPRLVFCLGGR